MFSQQLQQCVDSGVTQMTELHEPVENPGLLHTPHSSAFVAATRLSTCVLYPFQLLQENTQMALEMC